MFPIGLKKGHYNPLRWTLQSGERGLVKLLQLKQNHSKIALSSRMMDQTETNFQTLISNGWNFRNPEEIKSLIIQSKNLIETVESELLNMDLRSIGAKSLPDRSSLKKSSYMTGPIILQLVSLRDICQSSIDAAIKNVQRSHRLLKFVLTDGYSEVTAIEYTPMPSISEEIIPGTKIRIENKVAVRNGILCLNPKSITIIGGYVPSLYEEWQMSRKYSGFSRSSLRLSQNENGAGPPPFEKLQLNTDHQADRRQHSPDVFQPTSKDHVCKDDGTQERNQGIQTVCKGSYSNSTSIKRSDSYKEIQETINHKIEEKPSTSDSRPKEVSEAIPVQNQAAAQKLLQKLNQSNYGERNSRGRGYRFKGKQEESQVFTLEEWEKRKSNSVKRTTNDNTQDISRDEELARQLQNQLDLEDFHEEPKYTEADRIRMSMFSFGETEENSRSGQFRGRGRGRGGSGRGRGRGRARGRIN